MQSNIEQYKQLSATDLLAFFAMIIGMFMAVLDIQIVASSISVIGAGLSASADELSWVQTAYIIAEVIVIPVTGFLARLLSTRILYFIATLGFTIMSIGCSAAWNIESMIFFRALQGMFGGAMIPTAFATSFIIFPPAKRAKIGIIMGLVVTVAPTVGPTIGGYITDIFSWHFMFLLNILPGIFVCSVIFLYCDFDQPDHSLLNNFDYPGAVLLISSLGCLEYVLEEGSKLGWLESNMILSLVIIVIVSLLLLVYNELTRPNPILSLRSFKNTNFILGCLYSAVIGVGLYGSVYLLPMFLFRVAGMTSMQIGFVMMVTGIFQFFSAPIAGKLYSSGLDHRVILALGLVMLGMGCYTNSALTPDSGFDSFFISQALRGFALMFCFIPINDIALGTIPKSELQNASGLYNLMRNLGGAIGLAIMNSSIVNNTHHNIEYLSSGIRITDAEKILTLQHTFVSSLSQNLQNSKIVGLSILDNLITQNAFVISINNIFVDLAFMFFLSIFLLPFAKKSNINSDNSASH